MMKTCGEWVKVESLKRKRIRVGVGGRPPPGAHEGGGGGAQRPAIHTTFMFITAPIIFDSHAMQCESM